MSADEFSVEFDILYNNIQSNQSPGLNLLEKSILLTQAKELVIKDLYSGNSGPYEANEEVMQYLQKLTYQTNYTIDSSETGGQQYNFDMSDMEPKCWFIVYEQAKLKRDDCDESYYVPVTAITHNEFAKAMDNPFRKPDRRTVLRVLIGDTIQLYCDDKTALQGYSVRYLAQPSKIYLDNFTQGNVPDEWIFPSSITWSEYKTNVCPDLPKSLHRTILIKAVQLAKAAWA